MAQHAQGFRAKVRMYRHGLGDCLLVTLPCNNAQNYYILIDCGVILGTAKPEELMQRVLSDVVQVTGNKIDLLVATHEHWDHLSGFVQAADLFANLHVGQVWLAWTEDPQDPLGRKLAGERAETISALRLGASRMLLAGDDDAAHTVASLMEFFGAARGRTTHDALEAVRSKVGVPRYCNPTDDPVQIAEAGLRIYVLGPPRDEKSIKKTLPSRQAPETYGLAQPAFDRHVLPVLTGAIADGPFGGFRAIPSPVAEEMDFFKGHYWGQDDWRRIDSSWLDASTELALQLEHFQNESL